MSEKPTNAPSLSNQDSLLESGASSTFGGNSTEVIYSAHHVEIRQQIKNEELTRDTNVVQRGLSTSLSTTSTTSDCYEPVNELAAGGAGCSLANLDSGISVGPDAATSNYMRSGETASTADSVRRCVNCDEEFTCEQGCCPDFTCYWCVQCEGYIIDTCVVAHLINKVTKYHSLCGGENGVPPRLCKQHKQLIQYSCTSCSEECCIQCMTSESHSGHSFESVEKVISEKMIVADGLINLRLEKEHQLQAKALELQNFKSQCLSFQQEARMKVESKFRELRGILQQMEHKMLNDLDNSAFISGRAAQKVAALLKNSEQFREELNGIKTNSSALSCQEMITRNTKLNLEETELLSASTFIQPKLVLMSNWRNESAQDCLQSFKNSVENAGYKLFRPEIRNEFELDSSYMADEADAFAEFADNQVPQTEHYRSASLASTVVRDVAYDPETQRVFIASSSGRTILLYSLTGQHLANIEVHAVPWRIHFRAGVLYYSIQSLEGVYALTVSGDNPQVDKLCHLKTCAFDVFSTGPASLGQARATDRGGERDKRASHLVLARVSKPEVCVFDTNSNQITLRAPHQLSQVHYVAQDPSSGSVAISNARDATVLLFSSQLILTHKLDGSSHGLKWPIGLCFSFSCPQQNTTLRNPDVTLQDWSLQNSENLLYVCDSDNHQVMACNVSSGEIECVFENLQGASFAQFVSTNVFLSASVLNLKIKFIKTEDDV